MIIAASMILLAGVAIGATGIGGILVVPVLTGLAGLSVLESVAASSCAFVFPGIVAFWRQRRSVESIPWAVYGATLVGAVTGALLTQWLPAAVLATSSSRGPERGRELECPLRRALQGCVHRGVFGSIRAGRTSW